MTPNRRPPHCKTCHKPLKGHKRGVCDTTTPDTSAAPSPSRSLRSASTKRSTKSAPHPVEALPTLSPQSTQILNNILRQNSQSAPPIQLPTARRRSTRLSAGREGVDSVESLHVALSHLTANDTTEDQGTSDPTYTPTEVDESEGTPELDESQNGAFSSSMTPLVSDSSNTVSTVPCSPSSSFAVSQQLEAQRVVHFELPGSNATIKDFLERMSESSYHAPATIFSFPKSEIRTLEDDADSLGLSVHVLVLPTKESDSEWVPVVVGKDSDAITKLLEDSEKLAQALRASKSPTGTGLGMSHVVVGTLGVLATWAGLAYS